MSSHLKGSLALITATFLYGFYGIFSRLLGNAFDLYFQFWTRNLLTALLALIPLLLTRSWKTVDRQGWVWFHLRAGCALLASITIFIAFNHVPIGTTYFFFYAGSTAGGYTIGSLLFKEKLTKTKVFSLILSIIGLIMVYHVNLGIYQSFYVLLALCSGTATAGWNTFSKKVSGYYPITQIILIDSVINFVILMLISVLLRETWEFPTFSQSWLLSALFAASLFGTGLLVVYGFNQIDAQIGSLIMIFEVPFAVTLSYVFFQETLGFLTTFGGLIIILAIVLPMLPGQIQNWFTKQSLS